jgi:putative PIN family toxin of toxin-antitoxin system
VRVFFDSNVVVSAFVARGLCADLLRLVLDKHELLTGEINLIEVRRALKRLHASDAQMAAVEKLLRANQVVATQRSGTAGFAVRDRDDAVVLATAIAARAELLVTGDQDLLVIAEKAPLPILTPRQAWERLRKR